MVEDLNNKTKELLEDKKIFKDYIKCFYDIEKVKETLSSKDEFKIIKEYMKKE